MRIGHREIFELMRRDILAGKYDGENTLPSETALARKFGVGRQTMGRAMLGVIGANQFAAIFDVVPSQFRSGSIGFLNVIGGLVGSLAPNALGALSERFGVDGFGVGFAATAGVELLAAVSLFAASFFTFRADRIC